MKYILHNIFILCSLLSFAQTTKLEYKVHLGKVYEDGSHVDFIEMATALTEKEQEFILQNLDKQPNILSLKFYENNPQRIRFKATANFTADGVMMFIKKYFADFNEKCLPISEYSIHSEVSQTSSDNRSGYEPTRAPCTTGTQYPSSTYTPICIGSTENITTYAYAGEYSAVNVTTGTEYTFTSSIPTYFITIATNATSPSVLATGTGSLTWTSTLTGTIRFYAHTNSSCGTASTSFVKSISCGTAPLPPTNTTCNNASNLPCGTSNLAGTTVGTTANTGIVTQYASPYGVWYTFVGDGQYTTISSTATFDHEIVVLSGSCSSMTMIADVDAAMANSTETYGFTTTNGITYFVYIAYYSTSGSASSTGAFTISRTCSVPPPPPPGLTDACAVAEAFCDAEGFTLPLNSGGSSNDLGRIACCSTTPYPMFYFMGVSVSGSINIYLESPTGNDIDFVAWGPFNSIEEACGNLQTTCGSCSNNTYDNGYPYGLVVDCSYSPNEYETCHIPNAIQGEIYVLLITNFEQDPGTISFNVTQTSTGEIDCSFLYSQIQTSAPACEGNWFTLTATNNNSIEYRWYSPNFEWSDTTTYNEIWLNIEKNTNGSFNLYTGDEYNNLVGPFNISTASGYYYLQVADTNGNFSAIDSVEVIIWADSDTTFLTDSILAGNAPYTAYGFNANTAGMYYINPPNSNGCDSVVRLELYFLSYDTVQICNTDLPYFYRDSILENQGTYTFQNGYNIHTFNLKTVDIAEIKVALSLPICADDGYISIYFEPDSEIYDILPAKYIVEFNDEALAAGFINQSGIFAEEIQVPFPDTIYPNFYTLSIIVYDSTSPCGLQIIENQAFEIYYPTMIMEQKWNNIIYLKNYAFNGGYFFAGYQWYKNGEIMTGETNSILYLQDSILTPGDAYYVGLTRADGSTILSCPYIATAPAIPVSEFPTIAQVRNQVVMSNIQHVKVARLWTSLGILLQNIQLQKPTHTLNLPDNTAYYLLEIVLDNGQRKVFSLAVH